MITLQQKPETMTAFQHDPFLGARLSGGSG